MSEHSTSSNPSVLPWSCLYGESKRTQVDMWAYTLCSCVQAVCVSVCLCARFIVTWQIFRLFPILVRGGVGLPATILPAHSAHLQVQCSRDTTQGHYTGGMRSLHFLLCTHCVHVHHTCEPTHPGDCIRTAFLLKQELVDWLKFNCEEVIGEPNGLMCIKCLVELSSGYWREVHLCQFWCAGHIHYLPE